MPVDAFVRLDRLRCLKEEDASGHSEPYAWTVALWVDDRTIQSGETVGSYSPTLGAGARSVVKAGIRAGEDTAMPAAQQSFARRFEDGLSVAQFGVVVALLEEDDTPDNVVEAAYTSFQRELPLAVADFVRRNLRGPQTDAERQEIAAKVAPKVRDAGEGALTAWEKLQVFLGRLNLDDQVGFDGSFSAVGGGPPVTTPFTLVFKSEDGTDHYEIDGRFELRAPRPPDPCQAEVGRVIEARGVLADYATEVGDLQEQLRSASPAEKAQIIREIRRIRSEDIPPAAAALHAAEQALARCRANQGLVVDGVVVADPRLFAPSG